MNKLRLLLSLYGKSLFGLNRMKYSRDSGDRCRRAALIAASPLMVALLMVSVGAYCALMCKGLAFVDALPAMPVTMFALASLLPLFSSLAHGGEMLLTFRDYDIQMSLPVSPKTVAVSRLLIVYLYNLGASLLVLIPTGAVYAWFARPEAWFYPVFIVCALLSPVIPVLLGSVLGALIARFSARFRGAKFVRIFITFVFLAAYMYFCFNVNPDDSAEFASATSAISSAVTRFYLPAKLFMGAITGKFADLALFAVLSVGILAVSSAIYIANIRSLRASASEARTAKRFHMREMGASSPARSLLKREFSRFFASYVYVINVAFGPFLSIVCGVAACVAGKDSIALLLSELGTEAGSIFFSLVPLLLAFMAGTCSTTACSISLEGNARWILQVIPVPAWTILRAKLLLNLAVVSPVFALSPALLCAALKPDALSGLFFFLMPFAAALFAAEFGLFLNLKIHRFDWKSENIVVKQSLPVFLTVLMSLIYGLAPAALMILKPDAARVILTADAALLGALSLLFCCLNRKIAEKAIRTL